MAPNHYSDTHCAKCGRELRTRNPSADIHMCSYCWSDSKRGEPKKQFMKLKEALKIAKELHPRQRRGMHDETHFNLTHKQDPTAQEKAHARNKGKITGVHL